jgi:RIO-like serine/threonine protein kinase
MCMTPVPIFPRADNGYKLTYMGLDYLAMRVFVNRGTIAGVGRRIGVGKGTLCGRSGWG